jgi:hypothetical protein
VPDVKPDNELQSLTNTTALTNVHLDRVRTIGDMAVTRPQYARRGW